MHISQIRWLRALGIIREERFGRRVVRFVKGFRRGFHNIWLIYIILRDKWLYDEHH